MLLTARNLTKWFGPRLLFKGITLGFSAGERVGLIGANGSGKSTMLRIFAGIEQPDEGELVARRGLRCGYVPQDEIFAESSCVDVVAGALDGSMDDHERHAIAEQQLIRAGFVDVHQPATRLSGGWKKRLSIVRQLVRRPDLLLLDEPTNHLDLEGIDWLEDLIDQGEFATLIVSHDRRFLEETSGRIIELSNAYPEGFLSHAGSYSDFVQKREEFMSAQQSRQQALASGVRREVEWLRRGAKARTTKAKGRIQQARRMMSELADLKLRNAKQEAADVDFQATDRQTRKLIELKNVSKSIDERLLFQDVSIVLAPGQRLGLLGPNGSGKSTLIKLIADVLKPDSGQVIRADQIRLTVFDQHRAQLDQSIPLRRALSPSGDNLIINGQGMHVSGWARRFLFRQEQLDLPVSELSGGEQARVLIARLMQHPTDVLILDEPTNDLDIPTLDVLQKSLEEFPGAVVLVTHDRYLMDRLCTSILALDGKGNARQFATLGQWEEQKYQQQHAELERLRQERQKQQQSTRTMTPTKKKLTWNEQKELEKMEQTILEAETALGKLQDQSQNQELLADHAKAREVFERLGAAQAEVDRLYARWEELTAKAGP